MNYRKFGKTDLKVSEIGFGAWGIGGPAMAGDIPIGWGDVNDETSIDALKKAYDLGINFYDTADFYGLGHSEELIGKTFSDNKDVIIATKVGHRLAEDNSIKLDYSKDHILKACEESLRRLKRETIDYYQLHSAKLEHLRSGDCIEAMQQLKKEGKIKYWGISLNTFNPYPEANFMMDDKLGDGFQVVFNIINQRASALIKKAGKEGYGIIARMPLQFGLLTGKFSKDSTFEKNDHRRFRLTQDILERSLEDLEPIWEIAEKHNIPKTSLSLSYILYHPEISTVIPGIKTPDQAIKNTSNLIHLKKEDKDKVCSVYDNRFTSLLNYMEQAG